MCMIYLFCTLCVYHTHFTNSHTLGGAESFFILFCIKFN
nr:MAG TPA: hypothetical protein [Caudoviricetes sp.]